MKFILSWSSLHKIYGSLIGKSIFIISLIMPIVKLNSIGISIDNYNFYLCGAILISIGFFIEKISLPKILDNYESPDKYARNLLERNTLLAFDERYEFANLYKSKKTNHLIQLAGFDKNLEAIEISSSSEQILGREKFIYYFGTLNFICMETSKLPNRIFCTLFFYIGAGLLYFPMFFAIFNYLGR